ncbi:MAG: sugar phosphate isomerase/epimerase [Methanomicrobiales archaeon]|nr:sugar phosphate isomerase/epimerase [Methanomicrobiales archaeon]
MARVAVSSMFFHEYPLADILPLVEGSGSDTLEFWIETPYFWLNGLPVQDLAMALREFPALCPIALHAPVLDLNPCSINPQVADLTLAYVKKTMEIAVQVGAGTVTVHPGKRTAHREPSRYDFQRFDLLMDLLRDYSRTCRARICIENMPPAINSLLSRPSDVRELLDREPWLWLTLDTAHALAGSERDLEMYWEDAGNRIANIHLSGTRDGIQHLPVTGDAVLARFLSRIGAQGYEGLVTLEIEDMNLSHTLGMEEKMTFLSQEIGFIRQFFR